MQLFGKFALLHTLQVTAKPVFHTHALLMGPGIFLERTKSPKHSWSPDLWSLDSSVSWLLIWLRGRVVLFCPPPFPNLGCPRDTPVSDLKERSSTQAQPDRPGPSVEGTGSQHLQSAPLSGAASSWHLEGRRVFSAFCTQTRVGKAQLSAFPI